MVANLSGYDQTVAVLSGRVGGMPTATPNRFTRVESPIGTLLLVGSDGALTGLYVDNHRGAAIVEADWIEDDRPFHKAAQQLDEYFAGKRTEFDLALCPHGTEFQLAVWGALQEIPYGETVSYGDIARRVGRPKGSRAVGQANGRNPISIIIPCHRVIDSSGGLGGYGWGPERKTWLLDLERSRPASLV